MSKIPPNNPTQGTNNMKPFDLVAALEGAPVVLRNGCKAYVLADTARLNNFKSIYRDEYTLVVIVAGGGLSMHMRDGSYVEEPDNPKDIIGMWSDPPKTIRTEATPHEIIQNMLTKGMAVWACVSDKSYDDARAKIGRHAYRVTRCSTDSCYPVWTWYASWKYAIPIDTATMTEITERGDAEIPQNQAAE